MRPDVLAISPHCDDAVFGCGDRLAARPGAVVVTLFAGRPVAGDALTPWDAAAGFAPGDDVIGARRAEDRAALAVLGALPVWMDFRDAQYGPSPAVDTLASALGDLVAQLRPHTIVAPLGLFHSDHRLASRAAVALVRHGLTARWLWYEDAIYRRLPGLVAERVHQLARDGVHLRRPERGASASARKRWAVRCYRSQLRALAAPGRPGGDDAFAAEVLWRSER